MLSLLELTLQTRASTDVTLEGVGVRNEFTAENSCCHKS